MTAPPDSIRRRPGRSRDEGSALVEFLTAGLLLMIPLVYLIIVLARLQAATFAADDSAQESGRAFVTARDAPDGSARAAVAARLALRDQGFAASDGDLRLSCDRPGGLTECLAPGTRVVADVQIRVGLPGLPRGFTDALGTSIRVHTEQVTTVDQFRPPPSTP